MKLPKTEALDLRALEIQVAEHNARPGAIQIAIWKRTYFNGYVLRDQKTKQPINCREAGRLRI